MGKGINHDLYLGYSLSSVLYMLMIYANLILILAEKWRHPTHPCFLLRYGTWFGLPWLLLHVHSSLCIHSQAIGYFNIECFSVVVLTAHVRVMVGEAWEQKITEDNWAVVTTTLNANQLKKKRKRSILQTNISKQKGNLLLPSFFDLYKYIFIYF